MKRVIALLLLLNFLSFVSCLTVVTTAEEDLEFSEFTNNFEKNYNSPQDSDGAKKSFVERLRKIKEHNADFNAEKQLFNESINFYSDLTVEAFNDNLNGFFEMVLRPKSFSQTYLNSIVVPPILNYLTLGYVTTIKNQAYCGSCKLKFRLNNA